MANLQKDYEDEDIGLGTKLVKKAQNNPFLAFGILGFATTLGIGAYRFKNRSKDFPMSLYFINLRVAAQSVVIGSLTIGMVYHMFNHFVLKEKDDHLKQFSKQTVQK